MTLKKLFPLLLFSGGFPRAKGLSFSEFVGLLFYLSLSLSLCRLGIAVTCQTTTPARAAAAAAAVVLGPDAHRDIPWETKRVVSVIVIEQQPMSASNVYFPCLFSFLSYSNTNGGRRDAMCLWIILR